YNVHIIDPGEQAIKINPVDNEHFPDYGTVACSHIELTDSGRTHIRNNCYTGGIDAHRARGWVVRDNLIEGFWCASGLSEHAVHFWKGSRGTLVERNDLDNNARGIGFGLIESGEGRTYPAPLVFCLRKIFPVYDMPAETNTKINGSRTCVWGINFIDFEKIELAYLERVKCLRLNPSRLFIINNPHSIKVMQKSRHDFLFYRCQYLNILDTTSWNA
ncbi:MAG: hypothetical protein J7L73_00680, partial [Anaerolineales bacterium]|nr:hypothetical protein [Anaerolineales bacterium]